MNDCKSPPSAPDRASRDGTDWRTLTIALAVPIVAILGLGLLYAFWSFAASLAG